jgi:excinuclease UvrABC ATPase subunit
MDVIKMADYIIDLGKEGGKNGVTLFLPVHLKSS